MLCGLQNICGSFVGTFVFWHLSLENKKNANVFILTGGGFSHGAALLNTQTQDLNR